VVTREQLESAFGPLWVETMPAEVAERHFTEPADRRLLTETGMPQSLLGQIYFGNVRTDPPRTLGETVGGDDPTVVPADYRDDIVVANGMGGLACHSRADGRVYWYEPADSDRRFALVNSSLGLFVETAWRVRLAFTGFDLEYEAGDDESPAEIGRETRRIVAELRAVDPPSFDSPALFWPHVVLFTLKALAADQ
jgi:SUKH-4 immunity protein of toxin-antitoxin system